MPETKFFYGFFFCIILQICQWGKKNNKKNILQINVYDQINSDIFVG